MKLDIGPDRTPGSGGRAPEPAPLARFELDRVGDVKGRAGPAHAATADQENDPATDTIPGTSATTANFTLANGVFAYVNSAGDQDWYRFHMDAGVTYDFAMTGPNTAKGVMTIYDATGAHVIATAAETTAIPTAGLIYSSTTSQDVFIAASAAGIATGQYSISPVDQVGENPLYFPVGAMSVGSTLTGITESGPDQDYYAVTLTAGVSYDITETGFGSQPILDAMLRVYDQTATLVVSNDDANGSTYNAFLRFTPAATGTYYVSAGVVNTFKHSGQDHGEYALSLDVTHDTYPADTTTTGVVAPGGSVSSVIDTDSDHDWFAVTLQAGFLYSFDLTGTGSNPLTDSYLDLYNAGGGLITSDDDSGPDHDAHIAYYATQSGTYYISAESFPNDPPYINTGSYRLSVSLPVTPTQDTIGDASNSAASLALGVSQTSRIDTPGDHDWYAVDLVAGQGYDFDVVGSAGMNGALELFDATGTLIAGNDDFGTGSDAHLDFEPVLSGRYYLSAEGSGDTQYGGYTVTAAQGDRPLLTQSIDWGTKLSLVNNTVYVYFATVGETFDGETSLGWSAHQIAQAMLAMQTYSNYIPLTFVQTTDKSQATFKLVTANDLGDNVLAYMNPPGTENAGVGVFAINSDAFTAHFPSDPMLAGGLGFDTIIHEIGHGLGLAHPFDNGGGSPIMTGVQDTYDYSGYGWQNQGVYTIMAYVDGWPSNGQIPAEANYVHGYDESPMAMDVAALQAKYGAKTNYHGGDDTYQIEQLGFTNDHEGVFLSIWDTGGTDTISAETNQFGAATIDLRPASMYYTGDASGGAVSWLYNLNGGLVIDAGVVIENATGSGYGDTITGNDVANVLRGNGGGDTIKGLAGDDTIVLSFGSGSNVSNVDGGAGSDTLTLNVASTAVTGTWDGVTLYLSAAGITSGSVTAVNIEQVAFTDKTVAVTKAVNIAPVLTGKLQAGVMSGGGHVLTAAELGASDFNGDAISFVVQAAGKLGTADYSGATSHGSVMVGGVAVHSFTQAQLNAGLVSFVQDGTSGPAAFSVAAFDGSLYSAAASFTFLTSVVSGDHLLVTGTSGADSLDAASFAAPPARITLAGGLGDDTYIVNDSHVTVTEAAGEGTDLVLAGIAYTLQDNVENLTLTGAANIAATGNGLNNTIYGNAGNNVLSGGAGTDYLHGGAGDDTYYVDSQDDEVWEIAVVNSQIADTGGNDTVISSGDRTSLSDFVETLILTGTAIVGAGNGWNNAITGNAVDNQLSGGYGDDHVQGAAGSDTIDGGDGNDWLDGGQGADTLTGGAGDDSYVVDDVHDSVSETIAFAGDAGGVDTVFASADFTLGAYIENLVMSGDAVMGAGNDSGNSLVGTGGANRLYGFGGDDSLTGGGGADYLAGGDGSDTYVFDRGDGQDEIDNSHSDPGSTDRLVLGDGIAASGIKVTQDGAGDLILTLTGTSDSILIDKALADPGFEIQQVVFADGTIWTAADLEHQLLVTGDGDDTITGTPDADTIHGQGGNDVIAGGLGDDVLSGDAGDDTLLGGDGADRLDGGTGNDRLDGGAGADRLTGGQGDDTYIVDNAGDMVMENAGEGADIVMAAVDDILSANVETLILTGSAVAGTGNSLDNSLTGTDGDNILDGGQGADSLTGGLGDDSYYVDNIGDSVVENAGGGTDTVVATISYGLGLDVENLTLTGAANLNATGNGLANILTGNDGNNLLDGGAGADTLKGGLGNDTYIIDPADTVVEAPGGGADTVQAAFSYTLGANLESLTLTGANNINATGNGLGNILTGNAGSNILDGGAGADRMVGGAGDDTFVVDDVNDKIYEQNGEGTDTVMASVSYSLAGTYAENLVLTGAGDIAATGNGFANVLTGNGGNNWLDGGSGADILKGGAGDDTYVIDNAGDTVVEAANQGNDTVMSSLSFSLIGLNVENLTLTGLSNLSATGNSLDNVLTGNANNNLMNGNGGADIMMGGKANDIYYVDNAGDKAIENANEGFDTVYSQVDFHLGDNVENLFLQGAADLNGWGNAMANVLVGNGGANQLSGGDGADGLHGGGGNDLLDGGLGADILYGGAGDDTYMVDNIGDRVSEQATVGVDDGGTDLVMSSVSFLLSGFVDNLTLTGQASITGAGNAGDNVIIGNAGNNSLIGLAGHDTLTGGAGADNFVFTLGSGADIITDFTPTQNDHIDVHAYHGVAHTLTQSGGDVVIDFGNGNSITVQNTLVGNAQFLNHIIW